MKNFIISFLLIFLFGNLCRFGLPWWSIAPIAVLVGWFFPQNGFSAFGAGFLAGALLWGGSAFLLDSANGSLLSAKVGALFQGASSARLLQLTALMGALPAAFGALTGTWLRDLGQKRSKDYYGRRRKSGRFR